MERRDLFGTQVDSELIPGGAAYGNPGIRFFGIVDRRCDRVLESRRLQRRIGRRKKRGGEVSIVDPGKGKRPVGVNRPILGGLGEVALEFVL